MVASLLRLLHSGTQDQRIESKLKGSQGQGQSQGQGNPTTDAFTWVLRKPGRFTTQWQRLDFTQVPDFGKTVFCTLPIKGELISKLYLVVTLPDIYTTQSAAEAASLRVGKTFKGPRFGWTNSIGHALIKSTGCDIGGNRIETLDGTIMEITDEFNTPLEKVVSKNNLIGRLDSGFGPTSLGNSPTPLQCKIALPFWFNRNDSTSYLPVDALNVDLVQISVQFRAIEGVIVSDTYSTTTTITNITRKCTDLNSDGRQWTEIEEATFLNTDGSTIPDISMPSKLSLGDTYLMAEYIYLDKPEANRFRINDLQYIMTQHTALSPVNTKMLSMVTIPIEIQNPCRHIYFYANRIEAPGYSAYFLATRDLTDGSTSTPWWPDCQGLSSSSPGSLRPGFLRRGSEPISSVEFTYEGSFIRYSTENCALFRSILPSLEEKKSPWHNRYMYMIPFGIQSAQFPASLPLGESNFSKLQNKELRLRFTPLSAGTSDVTTPTYPQYLVHCYLETYNILKIFGGRATLLFEG